MSGRIDINFINERTLLDDITLFLGQLENSEKTIFFKTEDRLTLAHFMAKAGIFPSVSQARKNGWDKPVPEGFNQFIVGKKKSMITVLNIDNKK